MNEQVINKSRVKDPKWTGDEDEYAIVVSRGEPRRSDLQVEQAVADQARRYLNSFTHKPPSDLAVTLAVQLIAADHVTPEGKQAVTLTAKHLRLYVKAAEEKLGELKESEGK